MLIDLEKLAEIKYELTSVGASLSDLSRQNDEYFQNIYNSTEKLTGLLKSVLDPDDINRMYDQASVIASQMKSVERIIDDMSMSHPFMQDYSESVNAMSDHFSRMSNDLVADRRNQKNQQIRKLSKPKKPKGPVGDYVSREFGAIRSKVGSLLNALKVPVLGAVGAGLVGLIAYGVSERQRLQAEAGEVSDILVMSVDSHLKKLQAKALKTVSAMQESLQKFYGINRQEYQAGLSELVKGGTRTSEWLNPVNENLGLVGKNALNLSLGFDKLLNQAGGTAAKDMVDNQNRYGMSVKETTDTLLEVLTTGRTSGLGYSRYYNAVKEAAEATEQLGVNIQTTSEYMGVMQDHFDSLKIPKQLGSAVIVKGLKGLSSGIQGLPEGWKMEIAERMGMGNGLEALTKFNETWMMMQQNQGDPEALRRKVFEMMKIFVGVFGGEYRTKYMLANQFGMGQESAFLAWETYKQGMTAQDPTRSEQDRKAAEDASKKAFQDLRKSYKTEAQKRTQWERDMNKWMKHISHIGMGLMGLMSNWLAKLLMFFRYLPELFGTIFKKDGAKRRDQILSSIDKEIGDTKQSTDLIKSGLKGLVDSGLLLMGDAFGKSIKNIEKAWTTPVSFDSYNSATGDREDMRKAMRPSGGPSINITAPPTVRTVYVSGGGPSVSDVAVPAYETAKRAAAEHPYGPAASVLKTGWLGEEPLRIVSYGVNDNGDVNLALVGQCPRCGLDYDEGFDEDSYKEDWQSTDGTKFISTKKKGQSAMINLDSPGSMEAIKNLEMTDYRKRQIQQAGQQSDPLDERLKEPLRILSQAFPGRGIKLYSSERVGGKGDKGVHETGKALDIGVEGVSKEDVFRTLYSSGYGSEKGGLGYYTNRPFVHVDVREGPGRTWVDESGAKEKSVYKEAPRQWIEQNLYSSNSGYFQDPQSKE